MRLNIPDYDPSLELPCPTHPRQLKLWLDGLPLVNMGETARAFYHALHAVNRHPVGMADRYPDMEYLHPLAGMVLKHLERHLVTRTLPLPSRSRMIVELMQTLLEEMGIGYKRCIEDSQAGSGLKGLLPGHHLGAQALAVCTHRAMSYLEQVLLIDAEMFVHARTETWQDINALYAFAEEHSLTEQVIHGDAVSPTETSTIRKVFLRVQLLALSRPLGLGMGEVDMLYAFIDSHADVCTVRSELPTDTGHGAYLVDLAQGSPAHYVPVYAVNPVDTLRMLELGGFLKTVRDQCLHAHEVAEAIRKPAVITQDLACHLLGQLTVTRVRESARVKAQREVVVALGMPAILAALRSDKAAVYGGGRQLSEARVLRLQDEARSDPWSGGLEFDALLTQPEQEGEHVAGVTPHWEVVDVSTHGYGLQWHREVPTAARVGELVGIREHGPEGTHWRIGVIRTLEYLAEKGLKIGVEVIGEDGVVVSVQGIQNRRLSRIVPFDILMLVNPHADLRHYSLLAPHQLLQAGDRLSIGFLDKQQQIEFDHLLEHSSSFDWLGYRQQSRDQARAAKQQAEEIEALWKRL
ncbi:MAG: hypothetical protein P8Y64_07950 [Gammaproteobacteria bacterium]|jgi:cyclic-di-GMP-binding protein